MNEFNEQSSTFRELGSRINEFLSEDSAGFSEDEMKAGSPILHTLDETRYHFADEQFLVAGGAKKIFKVYDSHAGRHVAIAFPIRCATDLEKEEFLREAQLTAKLQHPSILPIYEVGLQGDGVPYFVMRLLEGEELKNIIRERTAGKEEYRSRYPLEILLSIFMRVCDAVIYAHSRGVLHLDMKPSNIMVGRYGLVTLFDWGLAKVAGERGGLTLDAGAEAFDPDLLNNITYSGTMKGTPGYMAPEQVIDSGHVSARTDVYSLGAVFYFILTGTIPVSGSDEEEVIENTLNGSVTAPRLRRPGHNIPRSLGAVALKALRRNPDERYASVQELQDEIIRYRQGFTTRAEKAGITKKIQLFMRRHNTVVSLLLLFGVVLTTVITVSLIRVSAQRERAVEARQEAVRNLALYKEETRTSSKLYNEVKAFFINSINRGDVWNYDLMKEMVDEELGKDKADPKYLKKIYLLKGFLHFINEEFSAALTSLDAAGHDPQNNLYKQSLKFSGLKPDDSGILEPDQFAELLNMSYRNTLFRKNLLSHCFERHMARAKEMTPEEYLPIAIAMLNLTNDTLGWGDHVRLEQRKGGQHLNLSGAPYSTMRLPRSRWRKGGAILRPLNLVSLNLSGSAIRDFHALHFKKSFRELILLDVEIYDVAPVVFWLSEIPMERLVVRRGTFEPWYIDQLQKHFEVVNLPDGAVYP